MEQRRRKTERSCGFGGGGGCSVEVCGGAIAQLRWQRRRRMAERRLQLHKVSRAAVAAACKGRSAVARGRAAAATHGERVARHLTPSTLFFTASI